MLGIDKVYEKPLQVETLSEIINSVYLGVEDDEVQWKNLLI